MAPWFVAEADESDGTLIEFCPEHAIVLNLDADHLDHFGCIEAAAAEFAKFGAQTRGHLVFCGDDPRLAALFAPHPRALSYGFQPIAAYRVELMPSPTSAGPEPSSKLAHGSARFRVWHRGELLGSFSTQLLGSQNISNTTAVIALLHQLGFAPAEINGAIAPFEGAARRQQELYRDKEVRIFEDYGHHPTEIRATLRALRSLSPKRLLVAFQPHRFSRTQHLWREFAQCFGDADRLWLVELYPASEPEIPGIDSHFLAEAIRQAGQAVDAVVSLRELGAAIRKAVRPGDLVLFLGAGDITTAAHDFVSQLRAEACPGPDPSRHAPALATP